MKKKISYQGEPGANSHIACLDTYPDMEPLACRTFEDAFQAVQDGTAALAMIPIDNSLAGRVADIHHMLPKSNLHIIGEYFLPIQFHLMALPGATLAGITSAHSHVHALGQCRKIIRELKITPVVAGDTAHGNCRKRRICTGLPLQRNLRPTSMASKSCGPILKMRRTTPRAL